MFCQFSSSIISKITGKVDP